MVTENKIDIVGILSPGLSEHIHLQDYIYNAQGICRTLTARDYKDPIRVLIEVDNERK